MESVLQCLEGHLEMLHIHTEAVPSTNLLHISPVHEYHSLGNSKVLLIPTQCKSSIFPVQFFQRITLGKRL